MAACAEPADKGVGMAAGELAHRLLIDCGRLGIEVALWSL
jgi:hypothetical protein